MQTSVSIRLHQKVCTDTLECQAREQCISPKRIAENPRLAAEVIHRPRLMEVAEEGPSPRVCFAWPKRADRSQCWDGWLQARRGT